MAEASKRNRKNQILAAAVSLATAFTALFFPAAESFFLNPIDFGIPARQAILPLLLTVLGVAAGIWLLLNLSLLIHEKLFHAFSCLLFGCLIAFYIQMLCYNGRMTHLDGTTPQNRSSLYDTVNWAVILVIAALPVMLFLLKQVKPVIRFTAPFKAALIAPVCGLLFIMQLAGLTSAVIGYYTSGISRSSAEQYYLSYEPTASLSKKHNIVVFLVDRMDGTFIDDLMLQFPELADSLTGFTAYRNNTSCYTLTFPSVPEMLTGVHYEKESWADYIRRIWTDSDNILRQLHSAGYQVNLIGNACELYYNTSQIEDCVDNLECAKEGVDYSYDYFGKKGILRTEMRYSLYRALPYMLKRSCLPIDTHSFVKMDSSAERLRPRTPGTEWDLRFYQYQLAHPMHADNTSETFSYIHLQGAHDTDERVTALAGDASAVSPDCINTAQEVLEVRGDFIIIEQYLNQMKQLGIYDCSDIVILGDHGQGWPAEEIGLTTALLIKPANAPERAMQIDRSTEMSNAYFPAAILEYAGLDHSAFGISFADAAAGAQPSARFLQVTRFIGSFSAPELPQLFKITGDANDFSNWICLYGQEEYYDNMQTP